MIIDLILDRRADDNDGYHTRYEAREFYHDIRQYEVVFKFEPTISEAMDYGENEDIQKALCKYIDDMGYNEDIKEYINKVRWL